MCSTFYQVQTTTTLSIPYCTVELAPLDNETVSPPLTQQPALKP